ncbi:unnamed protein product, partial [Iphiclides podalirius]
MTRIICGNGIPAATSVICTLGASDAECGTSFFTREHHAVPDVWVVVCDGLAYRYEPLDRAADGGTHSLDGSTARCLTPSRHQAADLNTKTKLMDAAVRGPRFVITRGSHLGLPARVIIVIGERVHIVNTRVALAGGARAIDSAPASTYARTCSVALRTAAAPRRSARVRRGTDGLLASIHSRPDSAPHTATLVNYTWPPNPRVTYAKSRFA